MNPTGRVLLSAAAYFALVFGAGFILGTIRTLWLTPSFGAALAIAAELPIMLAVSVVAASWVMRCFAIKRLRGAFAMGGVAFLLLMLAEFILAAALGGMSPSAYAASLTTPAGALGLFGQVLFALIPAARARYIAPQ